MNRSQLILKVAPINEHHIGVTQSVAWSLVILRFIRVECAKLKSKRKSMRGDGRLVKIVSRVYLLA